MILNQASEMIAAISQLAPMIEADKTAFDRDRRITDHIVTAMHDIGLFSLWLPRELDGPGLNLLGAMRVLEALARIDGAPAWCAAIGTSFSRLGAFLPRAVATKIFVEDKAIVAGTFLGPKADSDSTGYRISGRIGYASGIGHSNWAVSGGLIFDRGQQRLNPDGTPETRVMLYPRNEVEVLDTWDVGGLRGTGSHDYLVDDLFIPEDYTVVGHGVTTACAGGLYRIPAFATYPILIAAVPLGIARAALDLFYKLAAAKVPRSGAQQLREDGAVQSAIGQAEGTLRAARAFLQEMAEEVDTASEAGQPISIQQRILLRLACAQVAKSAKETVQIVYDSAGGSSVYETLGIQRCFRDLYAAVQHLQVQSVNFKWAGQVMMGLEPSTTRY